jgi:hypothetical protein
VLITKGLCAPEAGDGDYEEVWQVTSTAGLSSRDYSVEAIFLDNTKRSWPGLPGAALLTSPVALGDVTVSR